MIDRLRRVVARIGHRLKRARRRLGRARKRVARWRESWRTHLREQREDSKERDHKREQRDGLRLTLGVLEQWRREAIEAGEDTTDLDARIAQVTDRIEAHNAEIDKLTNKIEWRRRRKRHALTKRRFYGRRAKFWLAKKTTRRRNLKRARQRLEEALEDRDPEFEPWMANGYPYSGLSASLRKWIAIAVVKFDLTVTSTKRNWGTGSYHDIWKAIDVAGSWERMIAFQRYVLANGCGNVLELYGPQNDANCDNGVRVTQPEGAPNEDLHDTHDHVADQ
jgi:hypothetical protein